MKRAAQLQPLSRQHHLGLNISRHAKECSDNPEDISKHWHKLTSYIDDLQSQGSHHGIVKTLMIFGICLVTFQECTQNIPFPQVL